MRNDRRPPLRNPYELFTGPDLDSFVSSIRNKVGDALNPPRRPVHDLQRSRYTLSHKNNDSVFLEIPQTDDETNEDDALRVEDLQAESPHGRHYSVDKGKGRAHDEGPGVQGLQKAFQNADQSPDQSIDLTSEDVEAEVPQYSDGEEYLEEDAERYRQYYTVEGDGDGEEEDDQGLLSVDGIDENEEASESVQAEAMEYDHELSPESVEHVEGGQDFNLDEDGAIVIDSDEEDGDLDGHHQLQRSPEWAVAEGYDDDDAEVEEEEEEMDQLGDDLPSAQDLEPQYDEEEADELDEEQASVYPVERDVDDPETDLVLSEDDVFPGDVDESALGFLDDEAIPEEDQEYVDELGDEGSPSYGQESTPEMRQIPTAQPVSQPYHDLTSEHGAQGLSFPPSHFPFPSDFTSQFDPTIASALEALQHVASTLPMPLPIAQSTSTPDGETSFQDITQATLDEQEYSGSYESMNGVPVYDSFYPYVPNISSYSEQPTFSVGASSNEVIDVDALDDELDEQDGDPEVQQSIDEGDQFEAPLSLSTTGMEPSVDEGETTDFAHPSSMPYFQESDDVTGLDWDGNTLTQPLNPLTALAALGNATMSSMVEELPPLTELMGSAASVAHAASDAASSAVGAGRIGSDFLVATVADIPASVVAGAQSTTSSVIDSMHDVVSPVATASQEAISSASKLTQDTASVIHDTLDGTTSSLAAVAAGLGDSAASLSSSVKSTLATGQETASSAIISASDTIRDSIAETQASLSSTMGVGYEKATAIVVGAQEAASNAAVLVEDTTASAIAIAQGIPTSAAAAAERAASDLTMRINDATSSLIAPVRESIHKSTTAVSHAAETTAAAVVDGMQNTVDMVGEGKDHAIAAIVAIPDAAISAMVTTHEMVSTTATQGQDAIAEALGSAQDSAMAAIVAGQEKVADAGTAAYDAVSAPITGVQEGVASAVNTVTEGVSSAIASTKETLSAAVNSSQQTFVEIAHGALDFTSSLSAAQDRSISVVGGILPDVGSVVSDIQHQASSASETVAEAAGSLLASTAETTTRIVNEGQQHIANMSGAVREGVSATMVASQDAAASTLLAAQASVSPVITMTTSTTTAAIASGTETLSSTAHTVQGGATSAFTSAQNHVESVMESLQEAPASVVDAAKKVFSPHITTVSNSISSTASSTQETAVAAIGRVTDAFVASQEMGMDLVDQTQEAIQPVAERVADTVLSGVSSMQEVTSNGQAALVAAKENFPTLAVVTDRASSAVASSQDTATSALHFVQDDVAAPLAQSAQDAARYLYPKPALTHSDSAVVAEELLATDGEGSQSEAEDDPFTHMGNGMGGPGEAMVDSEATTPSAGDPKEHNDVDERNADSDSDGDEAEVFQVVHKAALPSDAPNEATEANPEGGDEEDGDGEAEGSVQSEPPDESVPAPQYREHTQEHSSRPNRGSSAQAAQGSSATVVTVKVEAVAPFPPIRQDTINLYTHHHGPLPVRVEVKVPEEAVKREVSESLPQGQAPAPPRSRVNSARSTVARDPNAAVTRSHCTFRKVSIPILLPTEEETENEGAGDTTDAEAAETTAAESAAASIESAGPSSRPAKEAVPPPRTCFIVPGCALSAFDVVKDDDIEDCGEATREENEAKIADFSLAPIDPSVFAALHRLAGHDFMNDSACAWLPSTEERAAFEKVLAEHRQQDSNSTPGPSKSSTTTPGGSRYSRKKPTNKFKVVLREGDNGSAGPSSIQRSRSSQQGVGRHRRRSSAMVSGSKTVDSGDEKEAHASNRLSSKSSPIPTLSFMAASDDEDEREPSDLDAVASSLAPSVTISITPSTRAGAAAKRARSSKNSARSGDGSRDGESYAEEETETETEEDVRPAKRARRKRVTTAKPLSAQRTVLDVDTRDDEQAKEDRLSKRHVLRSASSTPIAGKKRSRTSEAVENPVSHTQSESAHSSPKRRRKAGAADRVSAPGSRAASVASTEDDKRSVQTSSSSSRSRKIVEVVIGHGSGKPPSQSSRK